MKIALIIVAAVVALWFTFMFLGQIFYWLGLAAICLIVFFVLKFMLGSYISKKKDLLKLK
jgi:hypothetical protein|tara:strand:+ start:618 stop:797 length:180 start_codon:yes stop_codon:yes gene_type:complete